MSQVHIGRWTDWSKGSVLGDQITIKAEHSNVLVAFIAVFITLVGGFAWAILSYCLHQLLVTKDPSDALHHQMLVLLRSRIAAHLFSWRMVQIGYAWRKRPLRRVLARSLGLALIAFFCYASFVAAGIALSLVATTGSVLLIPAHCGVINYTAVNSASPDVSDTFAQALAAWSNQDYRAAYAYAGSCYGANADVPGTNLGADEAPASNCNFFVQPALDYSTTFPTTCPFVDPSLCTRSSSGSPNVIEFDTGFLDTRIHLGKNSKDDERVSFRRVTTCSPLISEGFSSNGFIMDANMTDVAVYDYGFNAVQPPQTSTGNATFYYPYSEYVAATEPYYMLFTSTDILGNGQGPAFVPDPRLADNTTSITLVFLANRAVYSSPVDDPWFNATTLIEPNSTFAKYAEGWQGSYYYSSAPGAVMGCVNTVTICNPNSSGDDACLEWVDFPELTVGVPVANTSIEALNLNDHQQQLAQAVALLLYNSEYWNILDTLGSSTLIASEYTYGFGSLISLPLGSNQWADEVKRLQAISMSILQRDAFTAVDGPSDTRITDFYTGAADWDCSIQLFRSTAYMTFSVLGLGLIFGIGCLILVLVAIITGVVPSLQERMGSSRGLYQRQQWHKNDVLYLQKSLFEDRGAGAEWEENALGKVPTTTNAAKFLPFTDMQPISRSSSNEHAASKESLGLDGSEKASQTQRSPRIDFDPVSPVADIEASMEPFLNQHGRPEQYHEHGDGLIKGSAFTERVAHSISSHEGESGS